jgi:hypothetical protein
MPLPSRTASAPSGTRHELDSGSRDLAPTRRQRCAAEGCKSRLVLHGRVAVPDIKTRTGTGAYPITPRTFQQQVTASALSSEVPSRFSDQVLQRFNLRDRFAREPTAALAVLHATLSTEVDANRLFALAELSYLHAERTRARAHYLAVVVYTYAFLFRGAEAPPPDPLDPRTRLAAELYNRALTEGLRNAGHIVVAAGEHPLPFGRLDVDLPGGEPMWGSWLVAAPDAGNPTTERDRARLSATDRPCPFRIENLGS